MSAEVVERLRDRVIEPIKGRFVRRDEVIDLIALALVAGEHLYLFGPPGTAKSALITGNIAPSFSTTFTVNDGVAADDLVVSAVIGSGPVVKAGAVAVELFAYRGTIDGARRHVFPHHDCRGVSYGVPLGKALRGHPR